MKVCGIILAGGKARRFGTDKRFAILGDRALIRHAIDRLRPQVDELVLSSNDPIPGSEDLTHLADQRAAQGPLLGIAEGLAFSRDEGFDWLVTAPADSPFLPANLAAQLLRRAKPTGIAFAASGGRHHPVFGAWRADLAADIWAQIATGERKIDAAAKAVGGFDTQEWDDDPFFNVNREADLVQATARYAASKQAS